MELRQTEERVKTLQEVYERLRKTESDSNDAIYKELSALPPLELVVNEEDGDKAGTGADAQQQQDEHSRPSKSASTSDADNDADNDADDAGTVLQQLQTLRTSLQELQPKMHRFQKRLVEFDPITEQPRYGENTAKRVTLMLDRYQELLRVLEFDHLVDQLQEIVLQAAKQRLIWEQQQKEKQEQQAELERQQKQKQQAEESRQIKIQQEARQQQLAQLHHMAEESRQARHKAEQEQLERERQQREEAERQDREWVQSIQKGPEGIDKQLQTLRKSTGTKAEWNVAIDALYTIFQQIVSHPEETKFRRIRRDHSRFMQDIGRHDGGTELLIAAGFRPGFIDEVPSYISSEPNLEKDMDGWAAWFNLLKEALAKIEEDMIKG